MICKKCGQDYSPKIHAIHKHRCVAPQKETVVVPETVDDKDALIAEAKERGIDVDRRYSVARIKELLDGDTSIY